MDTRTQDPLDRVFADPEAGLAVVAGLLLAALALLGLNGPAMPLMWRTNGDTK